MKKQTSCITYLSALVIGIILLCLHEQVQLLKGIVIAMGILITIPSALMLISSFFGKKDSSGVKVYPAWYTIVVACAGLVLGIWMLCMPTFFETVSVYTLGVGLVLVGMAQIVFIINASRPYGANPWWYCIPVLTITGGLIICFIGPKEVNSWATLTTGILLIVYAANGLTSLGRECNQSKKQKMIESETNSGELSD